MYYVCRLKQIHVHCRHGKSITLCMYLCGVSTGKCCGPGTKTQRPCLLDWLLITISMYKKWSIKHIWPLVGQNTNIQDIWGSQGGGNYSRLSLYCSTGFWSANAYTRIRFRQSRMWRLVFWYYTSVSAFRRKLALPSAGLQCGWGQEICPKLCTLCGNHQTFLLGFYFSATVYVSSPFFGNMKSSHCVIGSRYLETT
jgi:hypothetical protein